MRTFTFSKFVIPFVALFLSFFLVFMFFNNDTTNMQSYYSQRENYIHAEGTLTYISYNEDNSALYLGFSELSPTFDDICFKIVGKNLLIVRENKIDEKIEIGDRISFITAPKYFGDGYVMPIAEITVNGEKLLAFDEGFPNFLDWLETN